MNRRVIGGWIWLSAGLLLCLVVAPAAAQDPCAALPTSGSRVERRSCNPRQDCLNGIPSNLRGPSRDAAAATCNRMPTSGTCPQTVNTNPRQDCVNELPKISISSVDGGSKGGNKILANQDETLIVRGPNVGMPGNQVRKFDEQVWSIAITTKPGCPPPNCVAIGVRTGLLGAMWRFELRAAHGHSAATGQFESVLPPAGLDQTGSPADRAVRARAPKPDLYFESVRHDLWGEKVTFQVINKGQGPSVPTNVYLYLYRVDNGRRELTTDHKLIPPLCQRLTQNQGGGPCAFFWQGEFHVPVTEFAKELELAIVTPEGYPDLDSSNNTYKIQIPGTKR